MVVIRFLCHLCAASTSTSATTNRETVHALPIPLQSQQSSQSCCPFAAATGFTFAGTKRKRECPTGMIPPCPSWPQAMHSSSEHNFDGGFGGSDSDSDEESCCEEDSLPNRDCSLPEGHQFQKVRLLLLRLARQRVKVFAANVRYVAPPDHQLPARKRFKSCNWLQEPTCPLHQAGDDSDQEDTDDGFLVVPHPQETPEETFHFSCPFYKHDSKTYRRCLLQHDFRTFDSVIKHLQCHHKKPPYCPMCSQTFDTVTNCDRHILKRTCEMGDLIIPEGLNSNQRAKLVNDKRSLSNTERWERVNGVVFPDAGSVDSPYLDQSCGLEISMARDYWKRYGWRCVSDFLTSRGMHDGVDSNDEGARVSLFKSTLEDLLAEIMQEHEYMGQ